MKISINLMITVLMVTLLATLVALFTILAVNLVFGESNDLIKTKIISHTTHGDGYQLIDSANNRTCLIYPDAPEPGDRLDCYVGVE